MVLIVSDIFGLSDELESLRNALAQRINGEIDILDPYDGLKHQFTNEKEAYAFFTKHCGLAPYSQKLKEYVEAKQEVFLVGFSVGASAAWQASALPDLASNIAHSTCFYGSQIRHHCDLHSLVDTDLIFPIKEDSFDINETILTLNEHQLETTSPAKVKIFQSEYLHGFMNKLSTNFNAKAYQHYIEFLTQKINKKINNKLKK